jgi:hypothetical protein
MRRSDAEALLRRICPVLPTVFPLPTLSDPGEKEKAPPGGIRAGGLQVRPGKRRAGAGTETRKDGGGRQMRRENPDTC